MKVAISEIVERNDTLNKKVILLNECLSKICKTIELPINIAISLQTFI